MYQTALSRRPPTLWHGHPGQGPSTRTQTAFPGHYNLPQRQIRTPRTSAGRQASGTPGDGNEDGQEPASPVSTTGNPEPRLPEATLRSSGYSEPQGLNSNVLAAERWTVLLFLPAALWGLVWFCTAGIFSSCYASLAGAATIAAAAFQALAPTGHTVAAAAGTASAMPAAVAAVDWAKVALRTAAGLGGGGAGREQVLQTLQEAGTGPSASWAVQALLPALCAAYEGCRWMLGGLHACGLPLLNWAAVAASVAGFLGVVAVMGVPLRPYLAPLLPRMIPKGRPSSVAMAALRAGGITCMVALLTTLQQLELPAPVLRPDLGAAAAAAAAGSPLLVQHRSLLYGTLAVAGDVVLAAWTAAVAAGAAAAVWKGQRGGGAGGGGAQAEAMQRDSAESGNAGAGGVPAEQEPGPAGQGEATVGALAPPLGAFHAARALAMGRLLLDAVLLAAVASGSLRGNVTVGRVVGMLWLAQQAWRL